MAISWIFYTNLQNKTQCVGFFTRTYKTRLYRWVISFVRSQSILQVSIVYCSESLSETTCQKRQHKGKMDLFCQVMWKNTYVWSKNSYGYFKYQRCYQIQPVTAYLSGYTGQICLRLSLYFQHINKLLQSKKVT